MKTGWPRVSVLALACAFAPTISAQVPGLPQRPSRDLTARPPGTAVMTGVVLTDDPSGTPVRRVLVTLTSGDLRAPESAATDDAGRFVFTGLPAGNYSLSASRPGFVTTYYGARRPGKGPGIPIAVLEGQRTDNLVLRLLHGSAVTGVVHDANGRPMPGVEVAVLAADALAGAQGLLPAGESSTTDDRGVYRVFGLSAGEYYVRARVTSVAPPGAARVDTHVVTAEEIAWAEQGAPAAGSTSLSPLPPAPDRGRRVAYAPVYYPGVAQVSAARAIAVGANEERAGIDLGLELVTTAAVSGRVSYADGAPAAGADVSLQSADNDATDLLAALLGRSGTRTRPDGGFTLTGVPPGAYRVSVRAAPAAARGAPPAAPATPMAGALLGQMLGGASGKATLWASSDVSVNGEDVNALDLRLQPGMTLSGRVVFDATSLKPPVSLTTTRLILMPSVNGGSVAAMAASLMSGSALISVAADGTFATHGVLPGPYRLQAIVPGMLLTPAATAGWVLRSVTASGRDVTDLPIDVAPGVDVTDMVVTFADRPTELSGTLEDAAGRPAAGYPIVIFSTDPRYWSLGSRRVTIARPSNDGSFRVAGLPPGQYFVCAVTDLDQNQVYDPALLNQLAAAAIRITLAEGEKKVQDLRLK